MIPFTFIPAMIVVVVVVAGAAYCLHLDNKELNGRDALRRKMLAYEKTQPKYRIKIEKVGGQTFYTKDIEPYMFYDILIDSKEAAQEQLSTSFSAGFFMTSSGLGIPSCQVDSALVVLA